MKRDFDKNRYSDDEKRVAEFLFERGLGGEDDPIGFILASYAFLANERSELRDEVSYWKRMERIRSWNGNK